MDKEQEFIEITKEDIESVENAIEPFIIKTNEIPSTYNKNIFKTILEKANKGVKEFLKYISEKKNLEAFLGVMTTLIPILMLLLKNNSAIKKTLMKIFGKYMPAISVIFLIYDTLQRKTPFGKDKLPEIPKEIKEFINLNPKK